MENQLRSVNTIVLIFIAFVLVMIYFKMPEPFTRKDYLKIREIKDYEARIEYYQSMPYYEVEVTNASLDVEVTNTVDVDGSVDCY